MIDHLLKEVSTLIDVSDRDLQLFRDSLQEVEVRKGDHFLTLGQVSRHIGYISQGLMMHYKLVDGNEVPCDFTREKAWIAYLKSFTTGLPSEMAIRALEDTHLWSLSATKMAELFDAQPRFIALRNYYTEMSFIRNTEYATNLATLSAKDRYYKFVKDFPDLANRIPQYLIAGYLGIKPQSLSRIRR